MEIITGEACFTDMEVSHFDLVKVSDVELEAQAERLFQCQHAEQIRKLEEELGNFFQS